MGTGNMMDQRDAGRLIVNLAGPTRGAYRGAEYQASFRGWHRGDQTRGLGSTPEAALRDLAELSGVAYGDWVVTEESAR